MWQYFRKKNIFDLPVLVFEKKLKFKYIDTQTVVFGCIVIPVDFTHIL